MFNQEQKILHLSIVILILMIVLMNLAGRGCPKRGKGTKSGSSYTPFVISIILNFIHSFCCSWDKRSKLRGVTKITERPSVLRF